MHTRLRWLLLLLSALFAVNAFAETKRCANVPRHVSVPGAQPLSCECGKQLAKIKSTLPMSMRITAACDLRTDAGAVNLEVTTVNLDNYLSSGNYYEGTIYLSGHLVISGSVVVEPAEDTSWEKFYPKQPLISSKTAFSEYLTDIALNGKVFNAPEIADTNPGECWRAEATISIDGIVVRLYDDSTRGASFDGVKVLKLSRYKKCSTQ